MGIGEGKGMRGGKGREEIRGKKVKECIAVSGIPSQSYGTSLAIWDRQCYLPPDTSERAPPSSQPVSRYSIYLPRRDEG